MKKDLTRIDRSDLRSFDGEATRLLLWAQDQGARVRITRRGHAMVYGPDGVRSVCVPPNMKQLNRSAQNARAAIARMFRAN